MENKVEHKLGNALVEARKESLKQMHKTSIRPHGKLWGMDVFSWYQPNAELVVNTIHTFPFPVVWVGNSSDIKGTIALDHSICSHLNALLFHDSAKISLSVEEWLKTKTVASVSNLEDALRLLNSFKQKNTVLLFTASGDNWETQKELFENFLSIHQTF